MAHRGAGVPNAGVYVSQSMARCYCVNISYTIRQRQFSNCIGSQALIDLELTAAMGQSAMETEKWRIHL